MHFGISKYLQEKHDCEIFAIIDVDKRQKEFYQKQNFVKFKKVWLFRDHLHKTNEKPDMAYLKNFEKKYNINLWQLAYSEREFIHYNKLYHFNQKEILIILQQECQFFERVLSEVNPDFLFIRTIDFLEVILLHAMSKSIGVRNLMLGSSKLASTRALISSNYDQIDDFLEDSQKETGDTKKEFTEFQQEQKQLSSSFLTSFDEFQKKRPKVGLWKRPLRTFRIITNIDKKNYKEFYQHYTSIKLKFTLSKIFAIAFTRKLYRKKFLDKNAIHEIINEKPFVYFPLHVEPEMNMLLSAPFYTNQIEIITNIAKSLPVNYTLLVKEHPIMKFRRWRKVTYYQKIMSLPNVKLVHPDVKSEEILKNCSLVLTISGSSALQAAFYEIPSIVFSDTVYSKLPFVFRIRNLEDLPKIIRKSFSEKLDYSIINEFVIFMKKNTFDVDIFELQADGKNRFYFGGTLNDVPEISISKMESYLNDNKLKFQKLALEYIKKMKQWQIHNENLSKV